MKKKFISRLLTFAVSTSLIFGAVQPAQAADTAASADDKMEQAGQVGGADINNDVFWQDTDGNVIYSQGGGIFKFDNKYYWYGVKYEEAEKYAKDPTTGPYPANPSPKFLGVTCYSSDDLTAWEYEGFVVTRDEVSGKAEMNNEEVAWVGRLGVAKVDGKYALLVQHECPDADNSLDGNIDSDNFSKQVLVLTSDTPNGEFKWNQRINMNPYTGGTSNTGDQTVFTDDDGTSYLVYSYGKGRGKMFLSKIIAQENGKIGLAKSHMVYQGAGREGNCMFKYNNRYYMCASDLFGWNASHAYYMILDSLDDEYLESNAFKPAASMALMDGSSDDFCHVTQTGFFYTVAGSEQETVIFCGDRWAGFAGNGLGFNQWCPLSFKEDGTPCFNSLSAWNLDLATGKWTVDSSNNYVKNASFDADRKDVPYTENSGFSQPEIAGWKHTVNQGTAPICNNGNPVTGKRALKLGDTVEFDCKISQVIQQNTDTADAVQLPDGIYDLTAKIKNSGEFYELSMYAESGDNVEYVAIAQENTQFSEVTLQNITVSGNRAEIGFIARGAANAFAHIDDVTLVRSADQRAADTVIDMINNIGTVDASAASKTKIDTARTAYRNLSPAQQSLVKNLNVLDEAEARYKELTKTTVTAKVDINKATVAAIAAQNYTGKNLTPAVKVTYGKTTLVKGKDYTVSYSNNKNIGTAKVTITGIGNYEKTVSKNFTITVKKDKVYTVGSYKYKITDAKTNGKGTVAVSGGKSKSLKKVNIDATVKIGGKSFKITSIAGSAFKGYKKLTSVTVGKNVTKIDKSAFEKCAKLKTIKINATGLKSVGKNAIKGINKKATIKCPKKQLTKYKKLFKSSTGYKKTMKIKK